MRILGIDPGSRVTGFGLVERAGGTLAHVTHGTIRTRGTDKGPARLAAIHRKLRDVVVEAKPDLVVVERTFVAAGVRSALVLGEARGVALSVIGEAGVEFAEYTAREIKQAVTGSGAADKRAVQEMVKRLLGLPKVPPTDAADALAAAICHAHRGRLPDAARRRSNRGRGRRSGRFVVRNEG